MNQELIKQAQDLFDSYDKWNAFIELSNSRGKIREKYFEKLKLGLSKHFVNESRDNWSFTIYSNEQYRWFITEFGKNSICLLWRVNDLVLWCDPPFIDVPKVIDLLNTPKFIPILNCFDFMDSVSTSYPHHFCEEKLRYKFNDESSYSGPDEENHEKLSWFAGNKTDEMILQIAEKVNRFRTTEITSLLIELNEICKKKN
jgi:hypothetical protein